MPSKIQKLSLLLTGLIAAIYMAYYNPVTMHLCGRLLVAPYAGLSLQPKWQQGYLSFRLAPSAIILDSLPPRAGPNAYSHRIKNVMQYTTITHYGIGGGRNTFYFKALMANGEPGVFALTEYPDILAYAYELTNVSADSPPVWWIEVTPEKCRVRDGLNLPLLVPFFLILLNLIIWRGKMLRLPLRFLKWATINRLPDDKAGRRH